MKPTSPSKPPLSTTKVHHSPQPSSEVSRDEKSKVCRDAWRGRSCSSQASCPRIHSQLCQDFTFKGRETCSRFHGRRKIQKTKKLTKSNESTLHSPKKPWGFLQSHQSFPQQHLGNGFSGNRHPDKKASSPVRTQFATLEAAELYLCYHLAELAGVV